MRGRTTAHPRVSDYEAGEHHALLRHLAEKTGVQTVARESLVLSRLYTSYDKMVYFKMNIEQMDHYDLAPTPPVLKHYDLTNHTEANGYVGERYSSKA